MAEIDNLNESRWATSARFSVADVPQGAINLNVHGREALNALQGFGRMWRKTFRVTLTDVESTPAEVMRVWKAEFPRFQPLENHFFPSLAGIVPGEVMLIDTRMPPGPGMPNLIPVASGVAVLYADDELFTVMTPKGFPEAGWNTFSVFAEDEVLYAQTQSLCRASDPIYEFGFRFMGGSRTQDRIWVHVLTALAQHFGVQNPQVETSQECIDPKLQWKYAKNVWYNAGVRSLLFELSQPLRKLRPRR